MPQLSELIVLSTTIIKRRHLSAKRRQLILAEGVPDATTAALAAAAAASSATAEQAGCGASTTSGGGGGGSASSGGVSTCRLFYVDPSTLEYKGSIPWSKELHAELLPKGQVCEPAHEGHAHVHGGHSHGGCGRDCMLVPACLRASRHAALTALPMSMSTSTCG